MKKLSLILLALIALTQMAWAQDVNYIECSWTGSNTGGHVVQTTKTLADGSYTTLANNIDEYPSLSDGWYVVASNCSYFSRIVINGNVNIVVKDGTELYCFQGIQIKDGCTLTIYAQSDGDGMGSVECHGGDVHNGNGDDAALGGNKDEVGGYLVIHGGNIYAHANHNNAAGIGGGNHKSGMRGITIWGGIIDAYGKNSGAGIGAGQQNEVATPVTIYGGTITAKSKRYGAGIGGGEDCGNGTIKIYGGTVNATGGQYGAGIGGGQGGSMGNPVYIYGGNVTTTGGECGAGIGGGENDKGGGNQEAAVYIYGGTVNATGGKYGAGIGGGDEGSGGPVYIYDGTVNATCSQYAAGIGGGYLKSNGTIRIYGGTVTADAGDMETCGAGIGTGCAAQMEYPIYIHGGTVRAYAGSGAGIGGGGHKEQDYGSEFKEAIVPSHNYSQIIIYGGDVYAESQNSECAAIGGGAHGDGGTIKIYGGNVEAKTYFQGASIGAGLEPDAAECYTDIYIYGGTVKAWAPKTDGFGDASGQCIGVGYDDNSGLSCTGNITLGETMKVYKSSDGTTAASSAREEACRAESGYVLVSECEHSFTYSESDFQHHLRSTCPYCNISSDYEFHTYGSDCHTCTKCGFNASDPKTLTFYEANAGGTGYEVTTTETHQYLTKCKLPSYTNVPSRLAFEGWVKVDEALGVNEALTVVTDEQAASMTIYKSGETYEVKADAIFKAVYKNGWSGEGSGTEADPYIISTIADFNQLASITASCYYYDGKYFRMDADLDFTGESFTPVGNSTKPFKGILDGEGHSISGIYVETADTYKALFGIVHGTVKNLTLTNSTFKANTNVGGIVCENWGTIENCHVTSSVSIEYYSGNGGNFGGIVGSNNGTVDGCTSAATVDGKNKGKVGGIVGYNEGTLKNSLYYGNNVINGECVGAIVGYENTSGGTLTSNYYVPWTDGPAAIVSTFSGPSQDVDGAKAGYTVTSGTTGLTLDFGDATIYEYGGVKVYDFGLSYDGVLYSGNGQQVTFTPQARGYLVSDIQANGTALSPNSDGSYTITMDSENVSITAATLTPAVTRIVDGYGSSSDNDKWAFIASPLASDIAPSEVHNLFPSAGETSNEYDLYRFDQAAELEWENWKAEGTDNYHFNLEPGKGYLYASKQRTELVFTGAFNEGTTMTVTLSPGWNLVGNPFTEEAYVNRPFYQMNDDGSAIVAIDTYNDYTPIDIPACTGIIVHAESDSETVTFSTTEPEQAQAPNNGSLNITLSQVDAGCKTMGHGAMLDNAIVSFNEGSQLGKFYFGKQDANIYIPQGGQEYAIAFSDGQGEMPLNFKAKENGTYTLSVNPEGAEMAYLHLIDNMTGADVDLLAGCGDARIDSVESSICVSTYTFTAKTTDYTSRFKLVFAVNDGSSTGSETFAFISNGNLIVNGEGMLQVIDMMGRVIVSRDAARYVSTNGMAPGVYVLRLINGDDVKVQKLVVR